MNRTWSLLLVGFLIVAHVWMHPASGQGSDTAAVDRAETEADESVKEAPYVPSPQHVVWRLLSLADVDEDDVVYDLGSGDGRIVLAAAKKYGARGVGIEIDSALVKKSRVKARNLGVADRVEFRQGDLFDTDLSEATVVTLYLWPNMNNRLRPKLQEELSPGDRVVSHSFDIDGWPADSTVSIEARSLTKEPKSLFLWTIEDSTGSK